MGDKLALISKIRLEAIPIQKKKHKKYIDRKTHVKSLEKINYRYNKAKGTGAKGFSIDGIEMTSDVQKFINNHDDIYFKFNNYYFKGGDNLWMID